MLKMHILQQEIAEVDQATVTAQSFKLLWVVGARHHYHHRRRHPDMHAKEAQPIAASLPNLQEAIPRVKLIYAREKIDVI